MFDYDLKAVDTTNYLLKFADDCSDILIAKTKSKTRTIHFSFTDTETNTEKILKTKTIKKI